MHLIVGTKTNLITLSKFYQAVFQAHEIVCEDNYVELESGQLGGRISFYEYESFNQNIPGTKISAPLTNLDSVSHCEIYVAAGNKLEEIVSLALKWGATEIASSKKMDWGAEVAYLRDPAGIVLAIASGY